MSIYDDGNPFFILIGFLALVGGLLWASYVLNDSIEWAKYQKAHHCVEGTKWTEKGRFVCDGGEVVTR